MSQFQTYLDKFNGIKIPASNLGIPRINMPQIETIAAIRELRKLGFDVHEKFVLANTLRIVQVEVNKDKVLSLMESKDTNWKEIPIWVDLNGRVLDGTHRFLANYNLDEEATIRVIVIPHTDTNHVLSVLRGLECVEFKPNN